ncbi:MAG: hypothetical protein HOA23_09465 [Gemmatimonadales bacterium]|nr:hypothetical protein [Gemmatimonadales bacterium]
MTAPQEERPVWSIQEAEKLILSLKGVVSARVIARPGGEVEEIHLLTTEEVKPKQAVRNVESALLAHLDLDVDHRVISVAQAKDRQVAEASAPEPTVHIVPDPTPAQSRLLFCGHAVESERSHQVRHRVEIEWHGERFTGESSAADLPRAKLEAVGVATLKAVEAALAKDDESEAKPGTLVTLALDGVKIVDAFDRKYALVAVHAISGRDITALAGATLVEESTDRAAILAALQATDRWVRGRV